MGRGMVGPDEGREIEERSGRWTFSKLSVSPQPDYREVTHTTNYNKP